MSRFRGFKDAQIGHFHASDILIVFLITVPLIVISVIGIRSIQTENALAQQRQQDRNLWLARNVESTVKEFIDGQISPYVDWINQHSNKYEEMRMWTFNRIEVDLLTVFSPEGERIFPESDQSALVSEISLINQIQGELSTVINNPDEIRSFNSFVQGDSDSKLLHCDVQYTATVCVLFNRNGWLPWLNQALQSIAAPTGIDVVIKLFDANGLPLGVNATLGNNETSKNNLVFENAMSGNFSQWHILLYEENNAYNVKVPIAYLMLLLPLTLLVFGCGIGLYWIYKTRSKQTQAQKAFTAELAHEVRTPLANIRLYIDLIKRTAIDKQSSYCSVVESEVERLSLLVENSILLARLDANQHQEAVDYKQTINPDELIKNVIKTMTPVFEENECTVTYTLAAQRAVLADKDALQRVLINLLDNARKYAAGKDIQVNSLITGNLLIIDIKDAGPGISNQVWQKIKNRDFSVMSGNGTGFGLGLQVCQRLCQRMKGNLERILVPTGTHLRVSVPIDTA